MKNYLIVSLFVFMPIMGCVVETQEESSFEYIYEEDGEFSGYYNDDENVSGCSSKFFIWEMPDGSTHVVVLPGLCNTKPYIGWEPPPLKGIENPLGEKYSLPHQGNSPGE
jgi:hypothetical protein